MTGQGIHAAQNSLNIDSFGFCGLVNRLVVNRQIVHDVLVAPIGAISIHPLHSVTNNMAQLVSIGRIVLHKRRVRGGNNRGVPIGMLQTLTGQSSTPRGSPNHETSCQLVSGCPELVTRPLETKH